MNEPISDIGFEKILACLDTWELSPQAEKWPGFFPGHFSKR